MKRYNEKGEMMLCIWGGGGDEPPVDDPGLWHTMAEYRQSAEEMLALLAQSKRDDIAFDSPKMIGRVYARYNAKPAATAPKGTEPEQFDDLEPLSFATELPEATAVYARYNGKAGA